jgi:hypothetical protein
MANGGEYMAETKRGPKPKMRDEDPDLLQEREDLDNIFSDLTTAYTVKVYRNEPDWCSGFLGEFHIGVGRKLSIQEVKNRFGGRVFDLRVYSHVRAGILKRSTLVIDDVPRREGLEINRDGTTKQVTPVTPTESTEKSNTEDPIDAILALNIPKDMRRKLLLMQMGLGGMEFGMGAPQQQPQEKMQHELTMQQMVMDMQNQARQSQMQMMQQQFEMHRTMMQTKQELEKSATPPNPINDMDNLLQMFGKIQSIKSELGGSSEGLAGQVLEQTVPLIESAMHEFLAYKKLVAQNEIAKTQNMRQERPELPARVVNKDNPIRMLKESDTSNPVEMAKQMAQTYMGLPPDQQSEVMQAFMQHLEEPQQTNEIIETIPDDGILDDESDMLSEEDRRLLDGNNENETGGFQDREHAGTVENDDPTDRPGDSEGFPLSTH